MIKPEASSFLETWYNYQSRILERHYEMFRYIKSDFFRAIAIVRAKTPTRGSKRLRDRDEKDSLKTNPLHGVIGWIRVSYRFLLLGTT